MKKILLSILPFILGVINAKESDPKKTRISAQEENLSTTEMLCQYSKEGQYYEVISLVKEGADINGKNNDGDTPLTLALKWYHRHNNKQTIDYLLANGANINCTGKGGLTPLLLALQSTSKDINNTSFITLLINKGADVNFKANGYFPLVISSQYGYLDYVKLLIDNNANINEINHLGKSSLIIATESNKLEVVKYLVENNANINLCDQSGHTALAYACQKHFDEIFQYLIEKPNINLTTLTNAKENLLILTCKGAPGYTYKPLNIIKTLLSKKILDINQQDQSGKSALLYACELNNLDLAKILIENGATVDVSDSSENTPLLHACKKNNFDLVQYLYQQGAKIYCRNKYNLQTPLMIACANPESLPIIRFLIQKGCNINATDNNKDTPLTIACKNNNIEIVKFLLTQNVDVKIENSVGSTALSIAQYDGRKEIYQILTEFISSKK